MFFDSMVLRGTKNGSSMASLWRTFEATVIFKSVTCIKCLLLIYYITMLNYNRLKLIVAYALLASGLRIGWDVFRGRGLESDWWEEACLIQFLYPNMHSQIVRLRTWMNVVNNGVMC